MNMPKRTLVKRPFMTRQVAYAKLSDFKNMETNKYSLVCAGLVEDSEFSGTGDQKGWNCLVYYNPKFEQKVLRFFASVGCDISNETRAAVAPDSELEHDQVMLYTHEDEEAMIWDLFEYEMVPKGKRPKQRWDGNVRGW